MFQIENMLLHELFLELVTLWDLGTRNRPSCRKSSTNVPGPELSTTLSYGRASFFKQPLYSFGPFYETCMWIFVILSWRVAPSRRALWQLFNKWLLCLIYSGKYLHQHAKSDSEMLPRLVDSNGLYFQHTPVIHMAAPTPIHPA